MFRVSFFVLRWCTVWTACKEFEICRVITRHGWHTFSEYWSERSGTLYLADTHLSRVSSPACFVWCAVQSVGSHDHSLNGTSAIVLTRSLKKNSLTHHCRSPWVKSLKKHDTLGSCSIFESFLLCRQAVTIRGLCEIEVFCPALFPYLSIGMPSNKLGRRCPGIF